MTSARHFASDMRKIREARGISIKELHDETKIPLGLINSFEEAALVTNPQFNEVYLRSFVRTYARVIGLDAQVALAALDEALQGRYQGQLAAAHPGTAPEPQRTTEGQAPDAGAPPAGTAPAERPRPEEPPAPPPEDEPAMTPPVVEPRASTAAQRPVRWQARASVAGAQGDRASRQWTYVAVGVAVLIGIIWGVFQLLDTPDPEAAAQAAEIVEDSLADTLAATQAATAPPATLGDTLHVYIVAVRSNVAPIRVTVDEDLRRPYWIEQGDSSRFTAVNRIVIEQKLDLVRLTLEGFPYPTDRRDERGRVVITRDTAQAFLEARPRPAR